VCVCVSININSLPFEQRQQSRGGGERERERERKGRLLSVLLNSDETTFYLKYRQAGSESFHSQEPFEVNIDCQYRRYYDGRKEAKTQ
jgi:hypothetical protein